MRRAFVLTVVAAAIVAVVLVLTRPNPVPELQFDASVPADLRALAAETWQDFLAAHPARQDCIAPAVLSAVWKLDDRAEYRPASMTVVIRVPGTAPNLRHDLTHEFAHHVEFTCAEHEELRAAFLVAQGFPESTDWFDAGSWETTPSEHYAETTAEVVLGRRARQNGISVSDEAVAVVRHWGSES